MIRIGRFFHDYLAHRDPYGRVANLVAICIAGNLPTYPLFVAWVLGHWDLALLWSFLTFPGFALVPWVCRRHPWAGKLLLCAAGVANTALNLWLQGRASGVQWFFLPCALLGLLVLRGGMGLAVTCLSLGLGLTMQGIMEQPELARLNLSSVVTLCCFMGYLLWRARRESLDFERGI